MSTCYAITVPASAVPINIAVPPFDRDDYGPSTAWFSAFTDLGGRLDLRVAAYTAAGGVLLVQDLTAPATGGNGLQLPKGTRGVSVVNRGSVPVGAMIELIR